MTLFNSTSNSRSTFGILLTVGFSAGAIWASPHWLCYPLAFFAVFSIWQIISNPKWGVIVNENHLTVITPEKKFILNISEITEVIIEDIVGEDDKIRIVTESDSIVLADFCFKTFTPPMSLIKVMKTEFPDIPVNRLSEIQK